MSEKSDTLDTLEKPETLEKKDWFERHGSAVIAFLMLGGLVVLLLLNMK